MSKDLEFEKNSDSNKLLLSDLKRIKDIIHLGGGKKKIEKQKAKGKLTARERIDYLIDKKKPVIEIGTLAGFEMYENYGGCPAGGVVVVMAYVSDRLCVIVANDATVKAGAWFPITGKKNLRAQEIAMDNHIPIIYLVDSAGVFLPMQNEIFPDKEHFGRIFRNNAVMSAKGINQIAAIMGSCVAGGAYLPIMSDESLIVDKTGSIFLAGPYLVKAAIGEDIDNETLGGAKTQTEISGICDYKMPDDKTCLDTIRDLMSRIGHRAKAGFDRIKTAKPNKSIDQLFGVLPKERTKPYDVKELLKCLVDDSKFTEYKPTYGKTIFCGYARIDGWSIGIIANQRLLVKNSKGEMQFGGVIYSDSADKSARFIMNCNAKKIPLVFMHDVTGFMVGSKSEHGGIIKDGAKMVNAMSNSIVPKFSIVTGNSYGAGNYAMCGKAYDPRLIVGWPSAKIAVMGGSQAAKTLLQIRLASVKEEITDKQKQEMLDEITDKYEKETTPYYAASRLWVDEIIDPTETRKWISIGIEAADHKPIEKEYVVGNIQT